MLGTVTVLREALIRPMLWCFWNIPVTILTRLVVLSPHACFCGRHGTADRCRLVAACRGLHSPSPVPPVLGRDSPRFRRGVTNKRVFVQNMVKCRHGHDSIFLFDSTQFQKVLIRLNSGHTMALQELIQINS